MEQHKVPSVYFALSLFARWRGLKAIKDPDAILALVPCCDIHTFGMKQPIDVAFVSSDGIVIESHKQVAPWKRLKCKDASITFEQYSNGNRWFEEGQMVSLYLTDNMRPALIVEER